VLPFVGLMLAAIILLCVFPEISVALPDAIMGSK
jgi:C4-dicarboxylate transporter, DctM subunit